MISQEEIKKILDISVNAPSGSNSQPWRFEVKENIINIIALPEKDHPILNFNFRGTWVAHGALIENIIITSSSLGYKADFKIFPDKSNSNITAQIKLEKDISIKKDELFDFIPKRSTNRNKFKDINLTSDQESEFLDSIPEISNGRIVFISDRDLMKSVGGALSMNEVVMFENENLHKLFFNEIVWNKEEEKKRGGGLYIETMGLKFPGNIFIKLFKNWKWMSIANKLGIAKKIAQDNAKNYSSGSVLGSIIVKDEDQEFITAGRLLERIWLKAEKFGMGLQLITGILFLSRAIKTGSGSLFSKDQIDLINTSHDRISAIFKPNNDETIALVFRIGYGGTPKAYSAKKQAEIKFI
ncbi:MAG: hypothetical protein EXS49_01195 [Candidatus Pacebacteria bacterium]|nr:hypothetical protein [Candidatus Paceibacterota bacterium]